MCQFQVCRNLCRCIHQLLIHRNPGPEVWIRMTLTYYIVSHSIAKETQLPIRKLAVLTEFCGLTIMPVCKCCDNFLDSQPRSFHIQSFCKSVVMYVSWSAFMKKLNRPLLRHVNYFSRYIAGSLFLSFCFWKTGRCTPSSPYMSYWNSIIDY